MTFKVYKYTFPDGKIYITNIKRSCDSGKPYKGYLWEKEGGDLGEALR